MNGHPRRRAGQNPAYRPSGDFELASITTSILPQGTVSIEVVELIEQLENYRVPVEDYQS